MLHEWNYESRRALSLREGDEFSPLGFTSGPWHVVSSNSYSDYLATGAAQIWTTKGDHLPLPWNHMVRVRTKDWPFFWGRILVLGFIALSLAAAIAFCE